MITLTTRTTVLGATGTQITDFLLEPTDEAYQRWWQGTHLRFHVVRRVAGHVGSVIYMDEYVGTRRLRMHARVVVAIPGRKIVWQMQKGVRLPATVGLELADFDGGVGVTHTIRVGLPGVGRVFDPVLGLYFSPAFRRDLDEHVKTEFERLRAVLGPPPVVFTGSAR